MTDQQQQEALQAGDLMKAHMLQPRCSAIDSLRELRTRAMRVHVQAAEDGLYSPAGMIGELAAILEQHILEELAERQVNFPP